MPKVIGKAEQDRALKNISEALKKMPATNTFLNTPNPEGKYTLSFLNHEGKEYKTPILCADKSILDRLAQAHKEFVAQDVVKQANDNRIELDPDEKEVLGL